MFSCLIYGTALCFNCWSPASATEVTPRSVPGSVWGVLGVMTPVMGVRQLCIAIIERLGQRPAAAEGADAGAEPVGGAALAPGRRGGSRPSRRPCGWATARQRDRAMPWRPMHSLRKTLNQRHQVLKPSLVGHVGAPN